MKASDLYPADGPSVTFTESVFVRPAMYTINGTLEETGAFLQGFYNGLGKNSHPNAIREAKTWFNFCRWACQQMDIGAERYGWHLLFSEIRRTSKDDSDGFVKLAELYIQFKKEQKVE